MQISVFLENVLEGIEYEGIELKEALAQLKEVGLQKVSNRHGNNGKESRLSEISPIYDTNEI